MPNILEVHVLQNFAPSNLNRDDTGAPKDAVMGGVRRARISSQCAKRAIRRHFSTESLIAPEDLGMRSKLVFGEILKQAEVLGAVAPETAIEAALKELKIKVKDRKDKEGKETGYLLFVGFREIEALAKVVKDHQAALEGKSVPAEVRKAVVECIGAPAVDVALFGRMITENKGFNVDAACQVAHAISTHRVDRDVDFFTAVDDFAAEDEAVSGMLGNIEFNSSCFYRYAVVNLDLLLSNLGGDEALARSAAEAFVRGMAEAVPTGKQNTFAAHNPPAFIGATVRQGMPVNLANAFEKPVMHREHEHGLTAASVARLEETRDRYVAAYGIEGEMVALDLSGVWGGQQEPSLKALVERVSAQVVEQIAGAS